ncbi:MAG TPA: radical SAM protein [Usitatibacter sp.]|jgi:uncharacterized protein|nr:radical SAM protein [Usitatibacter sp.]
MRQVQELANGVSPEQIAAAISSRYQELIMLPTEKCNFRCTYCYEDFELGKMSRTLQSGIERFLARRIPDLEQLRFSWFGGEPLLAKDVILRLAAFATERCSERGVAFSGSLTTNGYLLNPKLAKDLISLNQKFYQISLDGWAEQHDKTRRRADGRGTFDVIWANLIGMSQLREDFRVQIRVHISRQNLESVEVLLNKLGETLGHDPRFYLDFQHIRDLGGAGSKNVVDPFTAQEIRLLEGRLLDIFKAAHVRDDRSSRDIASEGGTATSDEPRQIHGGVSTAGPAYICYATKPNSILIRSNGRIGKCTVAFSDPRNDLGYLSDEGELVINNAKLAPWIRGLGSLDRAELGCPMVNMEQTGLKSPQKRVIQIAASR